MSEVKNFYIIIREFLVPKDKNKTSQKGFWSNPLNIDIKHSCHCVRNVATHHIQESESIYDLENKKFLKKRSNIPDDEMYGWIVSQFGDEINAELAERFGDEHV